MGAIFSRWRKKPSTMEVLEGLQKEIESLEKLKRRNLENQRAMIGSLILYSVLIYTLVAVFMYFYYWPRTWKDRAICLTPFLVFPVLVWLTKRFLHWYFVKRITKNEAALEDCKEKKKQILEDVMENETYKKAKEILEKFDPDRFKQIKDPMDKTPGTMETPEGQELRQRTASARAMSTQGSVRMRGPTPRPPPGTPHLPPGTLPQRPRLPHSVRQGNGQFTPMATPGVPQGPPLPRPVLPRERTTTDRFIDYLVGDGPENRYALICKDCHSHNGMALKEEFQYLSFRCCYCFALNPARKQRPKPPPVEHDTPSKQPPAPPAEGDNDDDDADEEMDVEEEEDDDVTPTNGEVTPVESIGQGRSVTPENQGQSSAQEEEKPSSKKDD